MIKLITILNLFRRNKIGIKICRKDTLDRSMYISAFSDGQSVEYKLDKWTKRPNGCGALAVFDTIKHARDFIFDGMFGISKYFFKCKYKKTNVNELYCIKFKKLRKKLKPPYGTRFAEKVKLIKRL